MNKIGSDHMKSQWETREMSSRVKRESLLLSIVYLESIKPKEIQWCELPLSAPVQIWQMALSVSWINPLCLLAKSFLLTTTPVNVLPCWAMENPIAVWLNPCWLKKMKWIWKVNVPQRTVTHPMDDLNINGCQCSLVEDVKEHDYAEIINNRNMKKIEIIEIRISRVYEVHSFFASQDILEYSYSLWGQDGAEMCVSICCYLAHTGEPSFTP